MNKAKWKAVYDIVEEYGFFSVSELLASLRNSGVIGRNEKWSDIGASFNGYDDLRIWIEENMW